MPLSTSQCHIPRPEEIEPKVKTRIPPETEKNLPVTALLTAGKGLFQNVWLQFQ